jgi:hypothetical protein
VPDVRHASLGCRPSVTPAADRAHFYSWPAPPYDRPFAVTSGNARAIAGDYSVIPHDLAANDLVMSHVSTNFDGTGFQQDWNVVFPLDRLHEMARDGAIGSVAAFHYSLMGATDPSQMETSAHELARLLMQDQVNAVLLVPV